MQQKPHGFVRATWAPFRIPVRTVWCILRYFTSVPRALQRCLSFVTLGVFPLFYVCQGLTVLARGGTLQAVFVTFAGLHRYR